MQLRAAFLKPLFIHAKLSEFAVWPQSEIRQVNRRGCQDVQVIGTVGIESAKRA